MYDRVIELDLSTIEPMAALPFHPSRAFTIRELQDNGADILRQTELLAQEQFGGKVELKLTDKLSHEFIFIAFTGSTDDRVPTFNRKKILETECKEDLIIIPGIKICPVTMLIKFIGFCSVQKKICHAERRQRADINLIDLFRICNYGCGLNSAVLVQCT